MKFRYRFPSQARPKRPGEVEGRDYHFVDLTEFNLMLNQQQLLEHAKVFDHYYTGHLEAPLRRHWRPEKTSFSI